MLYSSARISVRRILLLVAPCLLLVLAACEDFGDGEGPAAADPSPTPELPAEGDVASVDEDPVEVLFDLFDAAEAEDYRTIYDRLVSDFHIIEFDEDADERQQWITRVTPRNHSMLSDVLEYPVDDPDSWRVDEHDGFVVVRHREILGSAHVFRREDGEWRRDPGEFSLVMAWEHSLPGTERGQNRFMGIPEHYEKTFQIDDVERFPLHGMFSSLLYTFTVHDGYADATFAWEISRMPGEPIGDFDEYLYHDILIPLDGLTWSLNGETGPVEIVWTQAVLEDDHLVLPALPEVMVDELLKMEHMSVFGQFYTTLRLADLPDDVDDSDEVLLTVEDLRIGPIGEGAPAGEDHPLHVTFEYRIPMTSSTRILAGDVPVVAEDSPAPGDIVPVSPDDVPPGPDPPDLLSIPEVEYQWDGDDLTALITLDTGGVDPQWEREVEILWSDGETTIYAPESMMGGEFIEIEAERSGAPEGVEVEALRFEWLEFDLEPDPDAMLYEDRIETKWGVFPIENIVEATDGSASVYYVAAGRRWIRDIAMEHDGQEIRISGASFGRDDDMIPVNLQMGLGPGFVEARDALPLPAEVTVREIAGDVVIEVQ